MKKSFLTFLVTVGTVIGSGFLSGKEIVVFFSRFGWISFPCIFIAFFLFWGLFQFMLGYGDKAVDKLKKSKFSNVLNVLICIILSSAMFAGSYDLLSSGGNVICFIIMVIIIGVCFYIVRNGLGSLEKANLILVPIMIFVLFIGEILIFGNGEFIFSSSSFSFASAYYTIMYVVLNTSNSGVVLAHMGRGLSKKQKARVSFCSALVLSVILLMTNIILIKNPQCYIEDMPLISLFEGWQKVIMQIVILFGCLTTLFSLIFALSNSLRGLIKKKHVANILSVAVPLFLSSVGFGRIVSYLYPISSVLGIFLICDLFLLSFFKQTYKSIHSARKHTK